MMKVKLWKKIKFLSENWKIKLIYETKHFLNVDIKIMKSSPEITDLITKILLWVFAQLCLTMILQIKIFN
jgi:hypothetical protein